MAKPTPGAEQSGEVISFVVRTLGDRPSYLHRALESLVSCTHRPLQTIVVFQGNSVEVLESLNALASKYIDIGMEVIHNATDQDRRAENLNLGWHAARGRYLAFLDDDDIVAPWHASKLMAAIRRSGCVWAYGQVALAIERDTRGHSRVTFPFYRRQFSFRELLIENYVPIHSFLIDLERLSPHIASEKFHLGLKRSEDWDFLIRLAHAHRPAMIDDVVAIYFAHPDGSNTNKSLIAKPAPGANVEWVDSSKVVLERASGLTRNGNYAGDFALALRFHRGETMLKRLARRVPLRFFQQVYTMRKGRSLTRVDSRW